MKISLLTASNSEIISNENNNCLKFVCSQLYKNGFDILSNQVVKCKGEFVISALKQSLNLSDVVIFVCDNEFERCYMAKKVIADEFGVKLVNNDFARTNIENFSRENNIPLKKEDLSFCQIPEFSRCIKNSLGCFQGFLIEKEGKNLFFLPLFHRELKRMFFSSVLPYLLNVGFKEAKSVYVFKTFGIKNSELISLLREYIKNKYEIEIVCNEYLLSGEVIVNVTKNIRSDILKNFINGIYTKILPYVYADNDSTLPELIYSLLSITKRKLVFAEDFTAGNMSKAFFGGLENAKEVLSESYFTPTDESKTKILGVEESVFKKSKIDYGEIAYQMALGALENSGAEIVVSNCGDLSSGEVVFAIGNSEGIHIYNEKVFGSLEQKIEMATSAIFFRLSKKIKQNDFHLGRSVV